MSPLKSVVSAALACALAIGSAAAAQKLGIGDTPPDVLGKDVSGQFIHLADYRGKLVVISFWASWCPPCRKELPMLLRLQTVATRDRLVVLSVNEDQDSSKFRAIMRVLKDQDLTLIADASNAKGRAYDVNGIPHMVILGKDGRIAAIHVGYGEGEIPDLVKEINGLLLANVQDPPAEAQNEPSSNKGHSSE
jgi:thiol-disulfide isomerase/thioredoxin